MPESRGHQLGLRSQIDPQKDCDIPRSCSNARTFSISKIPGAGYVTGRNCLIQLDVPSMK